MSDHDTTINELAAVRTIMREYAEARDALDEVERGAADGWPVSSTLSRKIDDARRSEVRAYLLLRKAALGDSR